jgi:hypothetical protein
LPLLPERFFVLYGDSYLPCNYAAVEAAFRHLMPAVWRLAKCISGSMRSARRKDCETQRSS